MYVDLTTSADYCDEWKLLNGIYATSGYNVGNWDMLLRLM